MNLLSYRTGGEATFGAATPLGIVDLRRRLDGQFADLRALLVGDALPLARAALDAAEGTHDHAPDAIDYLPVIPNPAKIFCIGLNYADHRSETGNAEIGHPTVFIRLPASQVGHGHPLLRPRESDKFDFEGEIAVVIGLGGRRIPEQDAWRHVAGYAPYNDGSVRDWQRHSTQFGPGKNFWRTGGFGPWMTTADEIAPGADFGLVTRLNGQEVQRTTTGLMLFPIPVLIAYCSTFVPLEPGDVIVTGTPGGVGARRTPPLFMHPGDVVEVEVEGVGTLRNTIAVD